MKPPSQAFEWIQHGDASARKRARAHVTRGFRRQKAAEAKEKKRKDSSDDSSEGGSPPEDRIAKIFTDTHITESLDRPGTSSEEGSPPILELGPTLGSGRADPFGSMPIELGPGTHALLDHCKFICRAPFETGLLILCCSPVRCSTSDLSSG